MTGIGKKHEALVTMATLASILLVNAMTIGTGGQIALARHQDTTKAFENSYINVPTDTNQGQACGTAGSASPISESCTASSSNTISQAPAQAPPSPCKPTMHPTVLTLNLSPPNTQPGGTVGGTGKLIDICTGQGVADITIRFTIQFPLPPGIVLIDQGIAMTTTNGVFELPIGVPFQAIAGTGTVRTQFSG